MTLFNVLLYCCIYVCMSNKRFRYVSYELNFESQIVSGRSPRELVYCTKWEIRKDNNMIDDLYV